MFVLNVEQTKQNKAGLKEKEVFFIVPKDPWEITKLFIDIKNFEKKEVRKRNVTHALFLSNLSNVRLSLFSVYLNTIKERNKKK